MRLVLPLSLSVHAQEEAAPQVAAGETGAIELEAVTVIARRAEERAKDIPFATSSDPVPSA